MRGNTIILRVGPRLVFRTGALFQYDHGQRLMLEGDVPETYQVHFSNSRTGESKPMIGTREGGVGIPDEFLLSGAPLHVWIYITGADHAETEYYVVVDVIKRAKPTDIEPTPQEQAVIDQLIGKMQEATERSEAAAEQAKIIAEDLFLGLVVRDGMLCAVYKEEVCCDGMHD